LSHVEVIPLEGEMLYGDPATLDAAVAKAQGKVRQMGVWASNHPVDFGGLGLSMVEHRLISEALGTATRQGGSAECRGDLRPFRLPVVMPTLDTRRVKPWIG
jgi:hypothetical protein